MTDILLSFEKAFFKISFYFHINLLIFEYHVGVLATQTSLNILSTLESYKVQLNMYLQSNLLYSLSKAFSI